MPDNTNANRFLATFLCAHWGANRLEISSPDAKGTERDKDALWFQAISDNPDPELASGVNVLLKRAAVKALHKRLGEWLAQKP